MYNFNIIKHNSPCINNRNQDISMLVYHYTACSFAVTHKVFTKPASEGGLSCHYVIDTDGSIHQYVDESKRAWHAGNSMWGDIKQDINSASIGIEVINDGFNVKTNSCSPYTKEQIESCILLGQAIMGKYNIKPYNVVAHSDIAPTRKIDPGPHFPWKHLADHNIGLFPSKSEINDQKIDKMPSDKELINLFQQYGFTDTSNLDNLKKAFQMHYNPTVFLDKKPFSLVEVKILQSLINIKN